MYTVNEEFYTKEVNKLLHEEDSKGMKKIYFFSTLVVSSVGYMFTIMEPLPDQSDFFEKLDDKMAGKVEIKEIEKPKPKPKPEPKKEEKVTTKRPSLKDVNQPSRKSMATAGGGDPKMRVTSKGVLGIISSTIKGASVANADPFGKGGFSSDLDALLSGTGGLKKGGGTPNGRAGAGGIGFGTGYGSGFGGGASGVSDLMGSVGGVSRVALKKRGKIQAAAPSSITGGEAQGGRSKDAIRRVVLKKINGLKYLYTKQLKTNPDLFGKITVKMVIAPSGTVIRATVLESSLNTPQLERDIVRKIKTWKFNRVPKGTATVIYPFSFSS